MDYIKPNNGIEMPTWLKSSRYTNMMQVLATSATRSL